MNGFTWYFPSWFLRETYNIDEHQNEKMTYHEKGTLWRFKWCTCLTGQTSFSLKSLFSPKWCLLQHSFGVVQSMGCKDPIPLGESSIWGICFICLTISSFLLSIVASGMPGLAGKLSFSTLSTRLPWAKCQDIRTGIPKIFLNIGKWKIITVFLRL